MKLELEAPRSIDVAINQSKEIFFSRIKKPIELVTVATSSSDKLLISRERKTRQSYRTMQKGSKIRYDTM